MPKSRNSRARLATAAGLLTGAVGAALLVAPTAALAASSVSPPVVPAGNTTMPVTIVEDTATFTTAATTSGNRVQILTAVTTCAATIPATSSTILAATTVASSNVTKSVTFTLPAGLTGGTNNQVRRYVACIYEPSATGRLGNANGYQISVGAQLSVTPASGLPGNNGPVTVSTGSGGTVFAGITSIAALFTTDNICPTTYGTPTANMATMVTKTSDSAGTLVVPTGVTGTTADTVKYSLCLFSGNTSASALISAGVYGVTQVTLSNPTGPYGGTNSLNVTSQNPILAGIDSPGALFTTGATCPTLYPSSDTAGSVMRSTGTNVRKVTDTRLAVTVPVLYGTSGDYTAALANSPSSSSVPWQLCVYEGTDTTASKPIASAPYSATTLHTLIAVTPGAGTALGGSKITVSGTAFPLTADGLTATLGGAPLTNITPLTATAFSAITPSHIPANNTALVVTTIAGSVTLTNAYSFTSALQVKPNTSPNSKSAVDVVVNGLGFQSSSWNSGNLTGAHIYLVDGVYSSSQVSSDRANPGLAECGSVLVLTDSELICRLNLTSRLDAAGTTAYSVAPTGRTLDVVAGSKVISSYSSTFSAIDIGKTVTDPGATPKIPANTTIVRILTTTSALLSNAASGTGSTLPVVVSAGGPVKTVTGDTHNSTTVDNISPTLVSADNGRIMFGSNLAAAGVTLSAQGGASVTVSANPGSAGTASSPLSIFPATGTLPVPEGVYNLTYVSNGGVNAVANDANYVQSGLSSGSVFTVASF